MNRRRYGRKALTYDSNELQSPAVDAPISLTW